MADRQPSESTSPNTGTWVYGVLGAAAPLRSAGLAGVAGGTVRVVPAAGLAAVVSSVDLTGFDDASAVRDLDLLEALARAHHRVLTVLAEAGPLVPFRLGTVYHHDVRVAEVVAEHRAELAAALRLAAGRTEWGVKEHCDLDRFAATMPDPTGTPARMGGAGTAYLLRRQAERAAAERLRRAIGEHCDDVHRTLDAFAAVSRRFPVADDWPDVRAGTLRRWVALNASYLVANDRTAQFAAAVDARRDVGRGIELALTGPWPPYSVGFTEGG